VHHESELLPGFMLDTKLLLSIAVALMYSIHRRSGTLTFRKRV